MLTTTQREAQKAYQKTCIKQVSVKLNWNTENEIIELLEKAAQEAGMTLSGYMKAAAIATAKNGTTGKNVVNVKTVQSKRARKTALKDIAEKDPLSDECFQTWKRNLEDGLRVDYNKTFLIKMFPEYEWTISSNTTWKALTKSSCATDQIHIFAKQQYLLKDVRPKKPEKALLQMSAKPKKGMNQAISKALKTDFFGSDWTLCTNSFRAGAKKGIVKDAVYFDPDTDGKFPGIKPIFMDFLESEKEWDSAVIKRDDFTEAAKMAKIDDNYGIVTVTAKSGKSVHFQAQAVIDALDLLERNETEFIFESTGKPAFAKTETAMAVICTVRKN